MLKHIKKFWLIYLFFIGLVTVILITYKDYGIIWDEAFYLNIGKYFVVKIFKLFGLSTNLDYSYITPLSKAIIENHYKTHGIIFETIVVLFTLFFKTFTFADFHLIKALLSLVTFFMIAKISYRLFKDKVTVLVSLILLLLFPRFYGEIFNNSADISTALFVSLFIGYFLYYFEGKSNFVKQIILGILLAIVINQRTILVYAFIITIVSIYLKNHIHKRAFIQSIKEIFTIGITTFIFLHFINPYLFAHPITGLVDMISPSIQYNFKATVLFDGRFIMANQLPWYYLPKIMLITIPPITIGLFLLGIISLLNSFLDKKRRSEDKIVSLFFLLMIILPFILVFTIRPLLYDNWRPFLFLTIPIVIIAACGFQVIRKIKVKTLRHLIYFLVIIGFILTAKEMVQLHPYQYIYYNSFVGGLKGANDNYEMEYSGAAYKEAVEWFNKNINDNKSHYKLYVMSDPISGVYFFKENTSFTTDVSQADYYISSTRWRSQDLVGGKIIHIIEREGVPLIYIKKIH